ncbi:hypothetical protein BDV95DRAFT_467377, partial [Massariosphaeria phaeospora]
AISDMDDFTDEELDRYFANYVPLSNLPTPPPTKEQHVDLQMPSLGPEQLRTETPELEVYANHLANLVPLNVSTQRPSIPTILGYLDRAQLPTEMIAFAACILDALSARFASSWRNACSSGHPTPYFTTINLSPTLSPDLIIISALSLSHGFIDDHGRSNSSWAKIGSSSQFTTKEIDATKRCILHEIDYGLFRITHQMVQKMTRDMQPPAANSSTPMRTVVRNKTVATLKEQRRPQLSLSMQGTAIWINGVQTPEPSP